MFALQTMLAPAPFRVTDAARRITIILMLALASVLMLSSVANAKSTVLLVHGGGWKAGEPDTMNFLRDDLQARGISAKTIAYKVDGGHIPSEITNVRRAVRAERSKGHRVTLYGTSAGGHLALALAARGEVDGAVAVSAPTNLASPWLLDGMPVAQQLGMTDEEVYKASPINRLTRRAAPTLIFHGDTDTLAPIEQGVTYHRKAKRYQKDTKFVAMRGVWHEYPAEYWSRAAMWIKNR